MEKSSFPLKSSGERGYVSVPKPLFCNVRLIIRCGLYMDKRTKSCQHPGVWLILGAAYNREITVILSLRKGGISLHPGWEVSVEKKKEIQISECKSVKT